jgi:hypothetical protein
MAFIGSLATRWRFDGEPLAKRSGIEASTDCAVIERKLTFSVAETSFDQPPYGVATAAVSQQSRLAFDMTSSVICRRQMSL